MSDVNIKREPLTYEQHASASYFRDRILAFNGDVAADTRLKRHADEMRTVIPAREAAREQRARAAGVEFRVNPNTSDGQGGYFSSPIWLVDHFASAPRAERVLARLMVNLPLPAGTSQVNIPRLTTGTAVGVAADGGAVPERDIVDAAVSQPVTPFAGLVDVPLQMLEQSPAAGAHLDWALFKDLTDSYDSQVEQALFNGSGTGQAFAGILNLPTGAGAVTAVSYTDASPTAAELAPIIAQAVAQLADKRLAPPEVILMRTARWVWIAISDNNILVGNRQVFGFPVDLADAIPATLGAGANQDAVVAIRASDSLLLESEPVTEVMMNPGSGSLLARLRLHGYATALHRQPTGIATVTGSGMIVASGY